MNDDFEDLDDDFDDEDLSMTFDVLSIEYDSASNKFVQHVRTISRDHDGEATDDLHNLIPCNYLGETEIEVNDEYFTVWHDGEFLNKPNPVPTFYFDSYRILCGNIVFTKMNEDGYTIGLTRQEINMLWSFYLRKFIDLINYLNGIPDFMKRLAMNDYCLPRLSGIYGSFRKAFRGSDAVNAIDRYFKSFEVTF